MRYTNELTTLLDYWKNTMEGISNPACRWYVLRGSNNNAVEAAESFASFGIPAFTPLEYKSSFIDDCKVWERVPCQPDLVFANGTYDEVRSALAHRTLASYQFVCDNTDEISPVTPSTECVNNLIKIVMASIPESYSVTDEEIHYRPGGMVEVIDGPFKGVVGRVARVHTQTRVVVSVPGAIAYATTYVPKHQIKEIIIS